MKQASRNGKGRRIDWREIRRRVDAAVASDAKQSPEEIQRILKERAHALAQAPAVEDSVEFVEIVEFQLAHERYALETLHVREVFPLDDLAPLPCTPAFVLGIVNLRGEIVSVVDIRKFFGLPQKGITNLDRIIVLESGEMTFGVLADDIVGVRRLPVAEMRSSQPLPAGIHENYVQGITANGLAVLDARAILADANIVVQEYVTTPGRRT